MLYQITNGEVAYGDKIIIKDLNFEIRNTEKIAVVGRNGCGKTTLLRLMLGELDDIDIATHTGVNISSAGQVTIGCLKQMAFDDNEISAAEEIRKVFKPILDMQERLSELLAMLDSDEYATDHEKLAQEYASLEERFTYVGGYRYEKDYELILSKFGFSEEERKKPLSEFSGGQRTKIAFIKLLLSKPDILLLDEPTNHLDISTINWLEGYLKEYPRAVVIVSHDRMFLDRVVDVVYEIEHQKLKRYPGNYTQFVERKRVEWDKQMKDYLAQQKEIERLQAVVDRFKGKPTKVSMAHSKEKAIEHMEKIDRPEGYEDRAFVSNLVPQLESGNDVLMTDNLAIGYDQILTRVTLDMKKHQKIGIIGGNGLGKSTFLKTIMEMIPKKAGKYKFGHNVEIGYFDQQMAQYTSDKTVLDEFWDEYPDLIETEVRNILGGFLFRGEDVFKQVSMLSGGEKVRLALAKIFQTRPNFLILDEPTNHMDIVGKEALEDMLIKYEGTVLFVSHDRYFVKRIADALLIFEDGTTRYFPYGYDAYEEKYGKEKMTQGEAALRINGSAPAEAPKEKKADEAKNFYNPGKEESKRRKRIERLETLIEEGENKIAELKEQLADPQYASDYHKLAEIQADIEKLEAKNDEYLEEWTELSE